MNLPSPNPEAFWQWLLAAAFVLLLAERAAAFWQRLRARPPDERYALRPEIRELDVRLRRIEERTELKLEQITRESTIAREKTQHLFCMLGESVASLQKETELQSQRLAHFDQKLDRIIERLSLSAKA